MKICKKFTDFSWSAPPIAGCDRLPLLLWAALVCICRGCRHWHPHDCVQSQWPEIERAPPTQSYAGQSPAMRPNASMCRSWNLPICRIWWWTHAIWPLILVFWCPLHAPGQRWSQESPRGMFGRFDRRMASASADLEEYCTAAAK